MLAWRDVAMLDDLQGRDELGAAIFGPPPLEAEGGERTHDAHRALKGAVVGFEPPDRDQYMPVDAVPRLDPAEQRLVLREQRLALATRVSERAPSRYSQTGFVNSGWLSFASMTSRSIRTPASERSKVSLSVMPALSASARKAVSQSAKAAFSVTGEGSGSVVSGAASAAQPVTASARRTKAGKARRPRPDGAGRTEGGHRMLSG